MGLLSSRDGEKGDDEDFSLAFRIAAKIQNWWNENQAANFGFNVVLYRESLSDSCKIGAKLFGGPYFAKPPGPFKRAAAFTVIGRLYPFFQFEGVSMTNRERNAWLARLMVLGIPLLLGSTSATLNGEKRRLENWQGFPSAHYKLEFLAWLRWLDGCENIQSFLPPSEWERLKEQRSARMVMATALMLEACYYSGTGGGASSDPSANPSAGFEIKGQIQACMENLSDELVYDLIYDYSE